MCWIKQLREKTSAKKIRPKPLPFSEEQIGAKAYEIWQEGLAQKAAPKDNSWQEAIQELQQEHAPEWLKSSRKMFFGLIKMVERYSVVLQTIGVVLIPVAIWGVSQSYQVKKDQKEEETRQHEAIKTYLNQLITIFLDGDIKNNVELQTATSAMTLSLLKSPNINGAGKGEVTKILSDLQLITLTDGAAGKPIISLSKANLSKANLSGVQLIRTDLRLANLSGADLSGADLFGSQLTGTKFINTNLSGAKLTGSDLLEANLKGANLCEAILFGAKLGKTNLLGNPVNEADLFEEELKYAKLCKTTLPDGKQSDRDCKELEKRMPKW